MKKVLFIDRDGTLLLNPPDEQVDSFEKMELYPGVITALARICRETDFELVMVTNQDGLGTHTFPEETFWPVHNKMLDILRGEGIVFSEIFIDPTRDEDNAPTRKPGTAMLTKYLSTGVNIKESYVIGDRVTDIVFAKNLGCNAIWISSERSEEAVLCTTSWEEIHSFLTSQPRRSLIRRKTSETEITVEINLDGSGKADISSGLGFLDHMLEQIPRHSGIDLKIDAFGDLGIDEHHTIEDIAISLGMAFKEAIGGKKGIGRYGFVLPMDDCLAQVAIDFSGRAYLVWDVEFTREKIGELPTEMFNHIFRSFSESAGCNLNIKAEGENEHHKIESVFKAFSRAVKMAVTKGGDYRVPSTKNSL